MYNINLLQYLGSIFMVTLLTALLAGRNMAHRSHVSKDIVQIRDGNKSKQK